MRCRGYRTRSAYFGIEFDGVVVFADGAVEVAYLLVYVAAIVERNRVFGIEIDGIVEVADGEKNVAFLLVCAAANAERHCANFSWNRVFRQIDDLIA